MRTKEQSREYMKQYRKKEPTVSHRPQNTPKARVGAPCRQCNTLIKVDDYLAENVNKKVFDITMRNPKNGSIATVYGTQRALKVLDKNGFMVVRR